jgi:hypothetical protein
MEKSQKIPQKFLCELCDYITFNNKDFNKHLLTSKHHHRTNLEQKNPKIPKNFTCKFCNKYYKARNSLWYHQQKCNITENNNVTNNEDKNNNKTFDNDTVISNNTDKDDLILMILKQNAELIEIVKNGTTNHSHNTTNSNNKAFNLNFFLNETCKNAMNITDFVDSIKLQLSDFMNVGEDGFVKGISNIIVNKLNSLDETIRPIHCTDQKREVFMLKMKINGKKKRKI